MNGFTLLETMIVLGVIGIVAGLGGFFISQFQDETLALNNIVKQIEASLKAAREKAVAQEESDWWGVHFEYPSGGAPFFVLFQGGVYTSSATTSAKISLHRRVIWQTPPQASSTDVVFEKISGRLKNASSTEVVLVLKRRPTFGKRIQVNWVGNVSVTDL